MSIHDASCDMARMFAHLLEIWNTAGSYILIDLIVLCRLLSIQYLTKEGNLEVSQHQYLLLNQLLNQILLLELKNTLLLYDESSIVLGYLSGFCLFIGIWMLGLWKEDIEKVHLPNVWLHSACTFLGNLLQTRYDLSIQNLYRRLWQVEEASHVKSISLA